MTVKCSLGLGHVLTKTRIGVSKATHYEKSGHKSFSAPAGKFARPGPASFINSKLYLALDCERVWRDFVLVEMGG